MDSGHPYYTFFDGMGGSSWNYPFDTAASQLLSTLPQPSYEGQAQADGSSQRSFSSTSALSTTSYGSTHAPTMAMAPCSSPDDYYMAPRTTNATFAETWPPPQPALDFSNPFVDERVAFDPITAAPINTSEEDDTYDSPASHHPSSPREACADSRPRCYEHGCNGRAFSCKENYRRHLREQKGLSVTSCELCGKVFTRKSNRDKHVAGRRCKALKKM